MTDGRPALTRCLGNRGTPQTGAALPTVTPCRPPLHRSCSTRTPMTRRTSTTRPAGCCWPPSTHLEGYGLAPADSGLARQGLVHRLPRLRREGEGVRDLPDARRATPAATRRSAGTPPGSPRCREMLGFYGLSYWYPWQVTCLGLGPVWQSDNAAARARAAAALDAGGVAAFGLSEKEHGADIYSSDMVLTPERRRQLLGDRRQVLHRQRQLRRHGVGLRPARRRRGPRPVRLLLRRQRPPGVHRRQERRAEPERTSRSSASTTTR